MATVTKDKLFTYDDFRVLVKDGQKADLIDGVIYMASPDNTDANRINAWLCALILLFVQKKKLGEVYFSRVACRFDEYNAPEPDILFVRKERAEVIKRGGIEGHPDLAVEIVSPDSVERDYEKKRQKYEEAGIPEYWIVDELEGKVTLLALDRRGKYRQVRPKSGILHSKVLPGFWLKPQWLWQEPLPEVLEVLNEILAAEE
ncbi:MAG: Uma2 family endonuclease [Gemmataceae bacterium]|nr:Uma2 family endonuclease [Gemmataceae bacterium]